VTVLGDITGTHLQNVGTADSPTFGGLNNVGPIIKRDGVTGESFGIELGNGISAGASNHQYIRIKTNWGDGYIQSWGGRLGLYGAGASQVCANTIGIDGTGYLGFANGSAYSQALDARLYRGGPGILEQRNGLNGQRLRVAKTWTSANSYEAFEIDATDASNFDLVALRGSAGGTARAIRIGSKQDGGSIVPWLTLATSGHTRLTIAGSSRPAIVGDLTICTASGIGLEIYRHHIIPANSFGLGGYDNLMDLGENSSRFRDLHLGRNAIIGGTLTAGTATFSGTVNARASTTAASTAPLKIATGVLMTTPEAGAIEYDGTNLYFTDSGGTRRQLAVV
jgi:hypothetical protein